MIQETKKKRLDSYYELNDEELPVNLTSILLSKAMQWIYPSQKVRDKAQL
jgi:hypothetical protein